MMSVLSSGATRKNGHVNAVILGDSLASDDDDLILPSHDFSHRALVPSRDHVSFFLPSLLSFFAAAAASFPFFFFYGFYFMIVIIYVSTSQSACSSKLIIIA